MPGGKGKLVDLGLDLDMLDTGKTLQFRYLDLDVEVADIADDRTVLHPLHVIYTDDVLAAGGGDEDVALGDGIVHPLDLVAFHRRLQRTDRVDLGDDHPRAEALHCVGTALADIAVTGHHNHLAGDHDVGGALDAVGKRLATTVEIVEL